MNKFLNVTGPGRVRWPLYTALVLLCAVVMPSAWGAKCNTTQSLTFPPVAPGNVVTEGTDITVTQDVTISTNVCGGSVGDHVTTGNAFIREVTWDGMPVGCALRNLSFCTAGYLYMAACLDDSDCDSEGLDDGVCTPVAVDPAVHTNPMSTGIATYLFPTDGLGGTSAGFVGQYEGTGPNYNNAVTICEDLVILDEGEECEGATITIDRASGNGVVAAPGGPYNWSFVVTVHACEDLDDVTAQGGTNGWALLVDRSEDSLDPSTGPGTAEIRKSNKKADVILWHIGDMNEGDTETLEVFLSGSLKRAPDCDERFLSGPWSALFSTDDGDSFQKTDYTGRVSIYTDSNGDVNDCF